MKTVADAAVASDSLTIKQAGALLGKTVEIAVAGQKYPDGAKYLADVTKYVRNLRRACGSAGYAT